MKEFRALPSSTSGCLLFQAIPRISQTLQISWIADLMDSADFTDSVDFADCGFLQIADFMISYMISVDFAYLRFGPVIK